jgi:hypothetical protein
VLIVVTNPYDEISYNKVNVYVFNKEYAEEVIEVLYPEDDSSEYFVPWDDSTSDENHQTASPCQ